MIEKKWYCGLLKSYQECCEPIIKSYQKAIAAYSLMRSRYSAYASHQVYYFSSNHVASRCFYSRSEILTSATSNHWQKLEIIQAHEHTIERKAYCVDRYFQRQVHHQISSFKLEISLT